MLIFLVLCWAAIFPIGFSDPVLGQQQQSQPQQQQAKNDELARQYEAAGAKNFGFYDSMQKQDGFLRGLRNGRDFDTLLGHSFGTSKRFAHGSAMGMGKRNFDEIDNAGFKDYLRKRNLDEIDNAGFRDYLKRNFDEIDNAGFTDYLSKRNFDEIDSAGFADDFSNSATHRKNHLRKKNLDEIDNAGFRDYLKRNLDEIDNAGFRDYLKRNLDEIDNAGFRDYLKRNLDEIDNAGFRDYLKRNFDEIDNAGFKDQLVKRSLRNPSAMGYLRELKIPSMPGSKIQSNSKPRSSK